jgi:hypothetical protein
MKVLLTAWAASRYDPPPSAWVLRKWVRAKLISPPPEWVGRAWYVEKESQCSDLGYTLRPTPEAPPPARRVKRGRKDPGRTALYRHFDGDVLLYVGIALAPVSRLSAHWSVSHWMHRVTRIDVAWHDTRADAEAAEIQAIRDEAPLYNVAHARNPRR